MAVAATPPGEYRVRALCTARRSFACTDIDWRFLSSFSSSSVPTRIACALSSKSYAQCLCVRMCVRLALTRSLTHSPTHSPTHLLIHSLSLSLAPHTCTTALDRRRRAGRRQDEPHPPQRSRHVQRQLQVHNWRRLFTERARRARHAREAANVRGLLCVVSVVCAHSIAAGPPKQL